MASWEKYVSPGCEQGELYNLPNGVHYRKQMAFQTGNFFHSMEEDWRSGVF